MDWFKIVSNYYQANLHTLEDVGVYVINNKITAEQYKQVTGQDFILTLQQVQQSKLKQIQDLYNQALVSGFTSSTTGTSYIFGYGQSDQMKFMKLMLSVNGGLTTFPVPIPAKDGTVVIHTQEQYNQLLLNINSFDWNMQNKLHDFINQVNASTTIDEVNALEIAF